MAIGTMAALGIGGLLLGGAGSFLGSKSANKAAKSAAATQQNVATQNNALARDIYGKNESYLAPFLRTFASAVNMPS
jgi:hypothetical protein